MARLVHPLGLMLVFVLTGHAYAQNNDNKVAQNWVEQQIANGQQNTDGLGPLTAQRQGNTVIMRQPNAPTSDTLVRDYPPTTCEGKIIEVFDYATSKGGDPITNSLDAQGAVVTGGVTGTNGSSVVTPAGSTQFSYWKAIIMTGCAHLRVRQIAHITGSRRGLNADGTPADGYPPTELPAPFPDGTADEYSDNTMMSGASDAGWSLDTPQGGVPFPQVPADAGPGAGFFVDDVSHVVKPSDATQAYAKKNGITLKYTFVHAYITFLYCDEQLIALVRWGFTETILVTGTSTVDYIDPENPYVLCAKPETPTIAYYKGILETLDPTAKGH